MEVAKLCHKNGSELLDLKHFITDVHCLVRVNFLKLHCIALTALLLARNTERTVLLLLICIDIFSERKQKAVNRRANFVTN